MKDKILLHGATDYGSSNYGDFLYGKIIYEYLTKKNFDVDFYKASEYFCKYLNCKQEDKIDDLNKYKTLLYIPGGYFGEGHSAKLKHNIAQFYRFLPIGLTAVKNHKNLAVLGIGAGPNKNFLMNYGIKKVCNNSKFVTVRDKESFESLSRLCPKANVIESFDLIVASKIDKDYKSRQLEEIQKLADGRKILLIHYNHSKEALEKFADATSKFIKENPEYYPVVTYDCILEYDNEYYGEFAKRLNSESYLFKYGNPDEFSALLEYVDLVLTCKLHVGVVACTFGTSVISVACHPEKTLRFYDAINESDRAISLFESDSDEIFNLMNKYLDSKIVISEELKNKANLTIRELDKFIGEINEK